MTGEPRAAVIVGLGNVGSQLVPLIARAGFFNSITLVDPDSYGESNLRSQNIATADVGEPKAAVQARVATAIDPVLEVTPVCAAVEDVPLALLRADVLLSAPDTRRARQHINRIVWRLDSRLPHWIDAGVDAGAHLVRVSHYVPGADRPCLECGWGTDDYAIVGEHYSCVETRSSAPATNGSPALGAFAAARMALLTQQVLSPGRQPADSGVEITMAVRENRLLTTRLTRNPRCRFDHGALPTRWSKTGLGRSLGELLASMEAQSSPDTWRLTVDGCRFARRLICVTCGCSLEGLHLVRPWSGVSVRCACGTPFRTGALDLQNSVSFVSLATRDLDRSLACVGLRSGDLVTLSAQGVARVVEVTGA